MNKPAKNKISFFDYIEKIFWFGFDLESGGLSHAMKDTPETNKKFDEKKYSRNVRFIILLLVVIVLALLIINN